MILFVDPTAEPSSVELGTATFEYTLASADEILELERECLGDDGRFDQREYNRRLLGKHVVGWSGVLDAAGNEVAYSDDARARLIPHLALKPAVRLRELIEARLEPAVAVGKS